MLSIVVQTIGSVCVFLPSAATEAVAESATGRQCKCITEIMITKEILRMSFLMSFRFVSGAIVIFIIPPKYLLQSGLWPMSKTRTRNDN